MGVTNATCDAISIDLNDYQNGENISFRSKYITNIVDIISVWKGSSILSQAYLWCFSKKRPSNQIYLFHKQRLMNWKDK